MTGSELNQLRRLIDQAVRARLAQQPDPPGDYPTCRHGHELSPSNVIERADGRRICRECQREYNRRSWARRKRGEEIPYQFAYQYATAEERREARLATYRRYQQRRRWAA